VILSCIIESASISARFLSLLSRPWPLPAKEDIEAFQGYRLRKITKNPDREAIKMLIYYDDH
jgi:hypothetical protein